MDRLERLQFSTYDDLADCTNSSDPTPGGFAAPADADFGVGYNRLFWWPALLVWFCHGAADDADLGVGLYPRLPLIWLAGWIGVADSNGSTLLERQRQGKRTTPITHRRGDYAAALIFYVPAGCTTGLADTERHVGRL